MRRIDSVYILCTARDLWLARIAVASVRYWSPTIPITLVKDPIHGRFGTDEVEQAWNVSSTYTLAQPCGWGFSRIELLFRFPGRRMLVLDADTILCGDVITELDGSDADFVVSVEQVGAGGLDDLQPYYYRFDAVRALDPEFARPRSLFPCGHYVATGGVLGRADFDPWLRWSAPVELRYPDAFHPGDQGVLNYVLDRAERLGRATVDRRHFAILASSPELSRIRLEAIRRRASEPFVVHFNGRKPPLLVQFPRRELLGFFERFYYSRITSPVLEPLRRALHAPPREQRRPPWGGRRRWLAIARECWPRIRRAIEKAAGGE
jgi:hypothetical protein